MFKHIAITMLVAAGLAATTAHAAKGTAAANVGPTVAITAPAPNSVLAAPANITLTANANDSDGTVAKVDFFRGKTLIGSDTTAPYSVAWNNVAVGSYTITAKATDNQGKATTSAGVTFSVNAPPAVSLQSVTSNNNFNAPSTLTLSATASDADGIAKVEFFQGSTLIGQSAATASPYTFSWANVAAGTYSITARATDNKGLVTHSTMGMLVKVNAAPTVSITAPAANALYTSPATITLSAAAADTDGTIAKVDFFHGTTLIGTATTAPYSVTWSGVGSGNYILTARATDNQGAVATSTATNVSVDTAPTVSITAPANNAAYQAPASIALSANAADTDGTIAKVEFFHGSTLIGQSPSTASPYTLDWSGVAAGNYVITARATDSKGIASTSGAINVSVNAQPAVAITYPANNASFLAPELITVTANASDSDGTMVRVEFYNHGTLIAQAIGPTSPYSMPLNNPAPGDYLITAKAIDNQGGTTTSAPVAFTVRANIEPTVGLMAPIGGNGFFAPASLVLTASADDIDGTVQRIDFYEGANLIGSITPPTAQFQWQNVAAGNYTLFAKATDNLGGVGTSNAIYITVNPNQAPTIMLEANPASGAAPGNVMLSANATDADGVIARVDFFNGNTLLASVTQAPFAYNWLNIAAGTYSVTARATDNAGASAVSAPVTVTIAQGVAQAYYIHADHLNTPRVIADQAGNTVWQWDNTDPFGANMPVGNAGFEFNLRFPGQVFDKETSLHYNYYRTYDPATGRYIESDPIGLDGGLNTYGYVAGNPLSYTDPLGLMAFPVGAATATTGAATATAGGAVGLSPAGMGAASAVDRAAKEAASNIPTALCLLIPNCAAARAREAAAKAAQMCMDAVDKVRNWYSKEKDRPDTGPPGEWIEGKHGSRKYGPDGRPQVDIDNPHQGMPDTHVHEWPGGKREHPGRPVPW